MSTAGIEQAVRRALIEALQHDDVDLDAPLELDSLSLLTVILSIEEALDIAFENEDLYGGGWLATGRTLAQYVTRLAHGGTHE